MAAPATKTATSAPDSEASEAVPKVVEVRFDGLSQVDEGALAGGLANHPPTGFLFFRKKVPLDKMSLPLDRRRVEAFLARQGYFEAEVLKIRTQVDKEAGEATVQFEVDQGPRTHIVKVSLSGGPFPEEMPSEAALLQMLDLKEGDPAVYADYQAGIDVLRAAMVSRGFAHAEVKGVLERKIGRDEARAVYVLTPGPRVRFGPISVDVNGGIPESSVRARIAFETGDIFDPSMIELTEGRLFDLPVVGSASVQWDSEQKQDPLPVRVVVRKGVPRELRLGGGVARDNVNLELRLRASYRQADFFHPLNTFSAELRPAFVFRDDLGQPALNITASTELRRDDFLSPRLQGTVEVAYDIIQYEALQTVGPRVSVALARPFLLDRLQFRSGFSYSFVNPALSFVPQGADVDLDRFGIFELAPLELFPVPPAPEDLQIRRLRDLSWVTWEVAVSLDQRDNPRSPRSGYYLQFSNELSYLFSPGNPYWFIKPEARGYVPMGRRLVGAARVRYAMQLLSAGPAPFPLRLFSGGAQSQRGFANRRLAPSLRNTSGDLVPVGGEVLLETNVELRLDLFKLFGNMFGVVAFLDGADSVLEVAELDPTRLYWATGGGLRYQTPIGPLRFDLGFRLNRTGPGDALPADGFERLAWHISLGEAF